MPYRLTVEVETQEKAAIIVQCLNKGEGKLISLAEVAPDENAPVAKKQRRAPRRHDFANGIRNKGISGVDLVMKALDGCSLSPIEIAQVFKDHGFAVTSASGAISSLARAGKIKPDPVKGTWSLA